MYSSQIGLTTKKEEELATALRKKKASLSEAEIEEIVVRTKDLKQYQDTPSASIYSFTICITRYCS